MRSKLARLKDNVWDLCSEYIRRRDLGRCFTCGDIRSWKEQNAGHFVHGKETPIYFDEVNLHCQCVNCNKWNSGRLDVYSGKLISKYGSKKVQWLLAQKYKLHHYTIKELEALKVKFQVKLKEINY